MALLLKIASEPAEAWIGEFRELLPDLEVRVWPDIGDAGAIEYALVANLPFGVLATLPRLSLVVSMPAGLDHLLGDPAFPRGVPLVRCLRPDGDRMMTEYAVLHVLRHHRQLPAYADLQRRGVWARVPHPATADRRVGVMGMGVVGAAAARAIKALGFDVAGWSRSRKEIEGIKSFAGPAELPEFLGRTEILLCLLPVTSQTRHILDAAAFAQLPKGAQVINLARGGLLSEPDLLAALDRDHLAAATLDVTEVEPLPADSPIWRHPRVTLTPHVGAVTRAATAAPVVAENIRRVRNGLTLLNRVDVAAGY